MRTKRIVVLPLILLCGCAGDSARVNALAPAMALAWPGVEEDALLGIRARTNADAAAALDVEHEVEGAAESRRRRVTKMAEAVRAMNGDTAEPTPAGRWHQPHDSNCECGSCNRAQSQLTEENTKMVAFLERFCGKPKEPTESPERRALIDIANDCGTLEAAQRRAKEGLRGN